MLVFFINLSLVQFQITYLALFHLFSLIDGFKWFWMQSLHKNIQFMLEFLTGSNLGLTFFLLYIYDLPDNVNCNIVICDDITVYTTLDQASDVATTRAGF